MKGTTLKKRVLQKHRGKSAKEAFLAEFRASDDPDERVNLAKAAPGGSVETVDFEITTEGSVGTLYKNDDDCVIWGPASVEVVDKEDDRIQASALEDALPQLLKRQTLSFEHTDQVVGEILDKFETDEPVELEIGGETFKRDTFPTDVLDLDGVEPALYVAGNVYNDTKKARECRDEIAKENIRSYSISGEALVSSMSIEDGRPINDISKLDLSAVTLCRSGMNQHAGFDVVSKRDPTEGSADASVTKQTADNLLKSTMGNEDPNDDDEKLTKSGMENLLDKHLPDGELATVEDVEKMIEKELPDEDEEPEPDTETVEPDAGGPEDEGGDGGDEFTRDELKEKLSADQWKAISQKLDEGDEPPAEGPEDPAEEPVVPEAPEDEDEGPEDEEMVAAKAQSLGLDPSTLSAEQKQAIAKADVGDMQTVEGVSGILSKEDTDPDFDSEEASEDLLAKGEGTTIAGGNFIGADGEVKL